MRNSQISAIKRGRRAENIAERLTNNERNGNSATVSGCAALKTYTPEEPKLELKKLTNLE